MNVALVTGATGLVGSHIVERLLAGGWHVRALVRFPDVARATLPPEVEMVHGDVLDAPSFVNAASGCHVVFHAAAKIMGRGGWPAFRQLNLEGTRNAIDAAGRARARLLHVSSVAVYGSSRYRPAAHGGRTDESAPLAPLSQYSHYGRSKRESEDLVLRAHMEGRVWATAVRPDVVYGTRDRQFVPRLALLMRGGVVPLINGGTSTLPIVHAANVADGAILAATSDIAGGKAYNLANDFDVTIRRFFELAGEGLGHRPAFISIPLSAVRVVVGVVRVGSLVLTGGRFGLVGDAAINFMTRDNPFSSDRAVRELGWKPAVRPETAIPEAFRWAKRSERAR